MSEETKVMNDEAEIKVVEEESEMKENKFVAFVKNHKKDIAYTALIFVAGVTGYKLGLSKGFTQLSADEVADAIEAVSDVVEDVNVTEF